jgi:hypothetical protein
MIQYRFLIARGWSDPSNSDRFDPARRDFDGCGGRSAMSSHHNELN